tara:strand:- start:8689 stop:11388 length:2700 start_codon:yes stop_codon:yes gene_type:complete
MIAKDSGTGKSFIGLVRYLEHGKAGEHADRVEWTHGHNLWTNDMATAAVIMRETAAGNDNGRLQKPVYHFSINWHPEESSRVDKATALTIAQEALKDLGLDQHQALIVAHSDREHFHLHVVVNRHNPELGKAWNPDFTYVKLEKAMARLSLEHGFEIVPGFHNSKELGISPPTVDMNLPSSAAEFEDRTGRKSFITKAREDLADVFERSTSWDELTAAAGDKGYSIERRGNGMVVTDGAHFAKPSSIDREFSRHSLERRFGEALTAFNQRTGYEKSSGRDQAPETQSRENLSSKAFADKIRDDVLAHVKASGSWQSLESRLASEGLVLVQRGRGIVISDGPHQAKLSEVSREHGVAFLNKKFDQTYKDHLYAARRPNDGLDRAARAREITAALHHLDRHKADLATIEARRTELTEIVAKTQPAMEQIAAIGQQKRRLNDLFERIYDDPEKAKAKFETARSKGSAKAFDQFRDDPRKFGTLRGHGIGPMANGERNKAKQAHRQAVDASKAYQRTVKNVQDNRRQIDHDVSRYKAARGELSLIAGREVSREDLAHVHKFRRSTHWAKGMGNQIIAGERTAQLETAILQSAKGLSIENIRELPLGSDVRSARIQSVVSELRTARDERRAMFKEATREADLALGGDQRGTGDWNVGRLVKHGSDHYEHDKTNSNSYYVTLENDKGESRTIWGVDLGRAMDEADPKAGDKIGLEHMGAKMVTLPDGTAAKRNTWKVHTDIENQPTLDPERAARAVTRKKIIAEKFGEFRAAQERPAPKDLPLTAGPADRAAYEAVDRYATARNQIKHSSSKETIAKVQDAARDVDKHGALGRKYLPYHGLDKRVLRTDLKASRKLQYARNRIERAATDQGLGKRLGQSTAKVAGAVRDIAGRFVSRAKERERER